MANLKLSGVHKAYGAVKVLHGIDLDIRSGEFVVFVGPSGCGKSTLLRVIAGLEEISGGTLAIDGEVMNDRTPKERGIAMVFQSYALYPHMTVYENMAFGLTLEKGTPKEEIDRRVRQAAAVLQIEPYLDRLPKALSGGQRQRVAIGRAITRDPKVFLFDEPLSNLDAALRVQTRIEIARLHERMQGTTMIYVTHDQVEAMTLADRIVVLNKGRIEQVGTPLELYHDPDNLFVAQFIGSPAMNILPGRVSGRNVVLDAGQGAATISAPSGVVGALHLGVRPEDLSIVGEGEGRLTGRVTLTEALGEVTLIYVDLGQKGEPLVVKAPGSVELARGSSVHLSAEPSSLRFFDEAGRAIRTERRVEAA
ncbi:MULTISPECIES: ABC transporter ATP-binding protein [unclassified Aureimonas]|uniref:ABC transporter ATP-binding protein n=1 Tax=unclassified Aureimonas TaxID=2615206 RepID=UPI0006F72BEC|nr:MULTISPECIES: sn-glycerol-3-phosphate ABC transporter ATP-binding protein UgpC [unclassified Aureimonas]KQT57496.1 ABC transporter ATP-binding protein [Aureimonas sp. Leaf427]KQT77176.1 ABC transporter ATP-binding protein [Aureimonas sp. Leaf460]